MFGKAARRLPSLLPGGRTIVRLKRRCSPGTGPETNNCTPSPQSCLGTARCLARFTEQLFCLYLLLPGTNPDSPGPWPAAPNNCMGFTPVPRQPRGPNPNNLPRFPRRSTQKRARAAARAPIPRTISRARGPKAPPPRGNGVIWDNLVFFAIFYYLNHII